MAEIEENLHGGVGLVHITKGNLEKIKIPLPPLDVQKAIVREIDPEQVYLFGSAARDEFGADSDVDFLIVENKSFDRPRSRLNEIRRIRRALASYRVSKDILVYNGEEVTKWRDSVNHIIGRCVQEGRLLYERR